MPLLKNSFPFLSKSSTLNSSFSSLSHHQPTQTHLPPNYEYSLLTLLHRYQPKINPTLQIHSQLITTSLYNNHKNQTSIIIWNTLIKHYSNSPSPQQSILVYKQMLDVCGPNAPTDTFTFTFLLKARANFSGSSVGTQFHSLVVKNGFALHLYVHTSIVNMYASCGFLVNAEKAFDEMPNRSSVSWNAMITGFAKWGLAKYVNSPPLSSWSNPKKNFMEAIKKLHAYLIITGLYRYPRPISKVFTTYALSPSHLAHAHQVFVQIQQPDSFIWNIMIRGFSQSSQPKAAIFFYNQMRLDGVKQDRLTFPFVLKACSEVVAIGDGRNVHCHALKIGSAFDVFVSNALIHLYASCGELSNARLVFDEMPTRDLVSWNSLISGYGRHNCFREVLDLFEAMKADGFKADKVTMVQVLSSCTRLEEFNLAEKMINYIEENRIEIDYYLGNTMINYYGRRGSLVSAKKVFITMKEKSILTMNAMIATCSKAGDLVSARKIFDAIPNKNLISWSSMITGYSQCNCSSDALALFKEMQLARVKPDEIVLVSVISACAHLGALGVGKWIHQYIEENNMIAEVYVGNSLINMYSKCGCIVEAFEVFGKMQERDMYTWNSIILGLATHGFVESALTVFSEMMMEDFEPNNVTFLGVLVACAHKGLVDKGLKYFESMEDYNVEPEMKHYGCVVDLLSRSGELDEAFEFIEKMPMKPDPIIWRTLLGACNVHGNVGLAERVTKKLVEVDDDNSGNYVLLSNTYTSNDRWNDAMNVREKMAKFGVEKIPGLSQIEVSKSEKLKNPWL